MIGLVLAILLALILVGGLGGPYLGAPRGDMATVGATAASAWSAWRLSSSLSSS